jgi:hypothetical protein
MAMNWERGFFRLWLVRQRVAKTPGDGFRSVGSLSH